MKTLTHIALTTLLLLTTFPLSAEDKNVELAKDKLTGKTVVAEKAVHVGGAVTRPGTVEYKDGITIYTTILAAGGPTEFGTLKRVKVLRDGKPFQLDLTQNKLGKDVLAKPGDVIEVPREFMPEKAVIVGGQVKRPGPIEYRDGTTIYAMIVAAGGPTVFGTLERVEVTRNGKLFKLDLTQEKSKNEEIVKLDDIIEVRRRRDPGR